jgi:hypothetical protein
MAGKIFVNYRRDDVPGDARGVCQSLATEFGKSNVFMDVDNLLAGQRFDKELAKALNVCDVLIAVMGPHWMEPVGMVDPRAVDPPATAPEAAVPVAPAPENFPAGMVDLLRLFKIDGKPKRRAILAEINPLFEGGE